MKRRLNTELDRNMVIAHIKRLDLKKSYLVTITEKRIKRTIDQNSLYWLWLTCIQTETGNDKNYLHEYFKTIYLTPETIKLFGIPVEIKSTKLLDTKQFTEYLNKIQIFASTELAIDLPDPNNVIWESFYDYYSDKL